MEGYIHSCESFGAVDGPGVRYVVFFQGCPLRCRYCHNPDTWKLTDGRCVSPQTLAAEIEQYRNFIRSGGVTLSGGEPLLQADFAAELLTLCKSAGFHTAIDTSGAVALDKCRGAVDTADLILLDIKDIDAEDCRSLTGQDNANAFALLDYCEQTGKAVWIRHVLVPGLTLSDEKLHRLGARLASYTCIEKVELNPFHKMGEFKWAALDIPYTLTDTPAPESDAVTHAKEIIRSYGLPL